MGLTDNIIELNRDMEPYIIQGSATRTRFFKRKFECVKGTVRDH